MGFRDDALRYEMDRMVLKGWDDPSNENHFLYIRARKKLDLMRRME